MNSVSIDVGRPRLDRFFGSDFCNLVGVDPNDVREIEFYFDSVRQLGVFKFWGFTQVPNDMTPWQFESDAPPPRSRIDVTLKPRLIKTITWSVEVMNSMRVLQP